MYGGVHFSDWPDPENVRRLDHGALPIISDMHRHGIRVDIPFLRNFTVEIRARQQDIISRVGVELGDYQDSNGKIRVPFSIGSPDHVSRLLFEHLCVQGKSAVPMTPKGKRYTTSDDVLERYTMQHKIVRLILDWRELDKLRGTYAEPLQLWADTNSRIHTQFNVTVAATGRLSSSRPNLQNLPSKGFGKRVRDAFVSSPGKVLISIDLAQIEFCWAAHRSQDPTLLEVFRLGQDTHTRTACIVFNRDYETMMALTRLVDTKQATPEQEAAYKAFKNNERLPCKTTGFGVLYGQTAEGLSGSLASDGIKWSVELCQDFIDNKFFGVYKGLRTMLERDYSRAYRYGMVWDDFGRVRLVPEAKSVHKRIANEGVRKAGNHPEQSSATGTIKLAMAELAPICRDLDVWPVAQIHDEILLEADAVIAEEFAALARSVMENASPLSIPVRSSSDIGETWGGLK